MNSYEGFIFTRVRTPISPNLFLLFIPKNRKARFVFLTPTTPFPGRKYIPGTATCIRNINKTTGAIKKPQISPKQQLVHKPSQSRQQALINSHNQSSSVPHKTSNKNQCYSCPSGASTGKALAVFFAHRPGIPPPRSPSPGNHPNKDLTYPHSQDALGAVATGAVSQVKPTAQAGSRRGNEGHQVWRLVQHL